MNVHPGQKVGLVGPNGAGKSSLFAVILGELHADSGDVALPPRWILSHVAQETPALAQPVLFTNPDDAKKAFPGDLGGTGHALPAQHAG